MESSRETKKKFCFLAVIFCMNFIFAQQQLIKQDSAELRSLKRDSQLGVSWFHEQGTTLLIETTKSNIYENVEYLLHQEEFRSEINETWTQYAPPLFWAMMNGNVEISELLLHFGANPNFYTKSETPTAFEAIDEFVDSERISLETAECLKRVLSDYGYGKEISDRIKLNNRYTVKGNLRLRDEPNLSGKTITVIKEAGLLKVTRLGKYENIDNLNSRWVYVEVFDNAKDINENPITAGKTGWCYGGYLE